jgi:hypothetical protein
VEVKGAIKSKKDHLIYLMKSPSGNTLHMADETGSELMSVKHAGGFGLNLIGGFKGSEPEQEEKEETKFRTAEVRGDKCVGCQTSDGPGEVLAEGNCIIQLAGMNGSGFHVQDFDGKGTILITAHAKNGEAEGPSIMMYSEDGGGILLTAGDAQLFIDGSKGHVSVTRQIILEMQRKPVEDYTSSIKNAIKAFMRKATYYMGGG